RNGVTCPCCDNPTPRDEIQGYATAHGLGQMLTAVVTTEKKAVTRYLPNTGRTVTFDMEVKAYRLPTDAERRMAHKAGAAVEPLFAHHMPFGLPSCDEEQVPFGASRSSGGSAFTAPLFGLTHWNSLFSSRQLLALGTFIRHTRAVPDAMRAAGYSANWVESV